MIKVPSSLCVCEENAQTTIFVPQAIVPICPTCEQPSNTAELTTFAAPECSVCPTEPETPVYTVPEPALTQTTTCLPDILESIVKTKYCDPLAPKCQ